MFASSKQVPERSFWQWGRHKGIQAELRFESSTRDLKIKDTDMSLIRGNECRISATILPQGRGLGSRLVAIPDVFVDRKWKPAMRVDNKGNISYLNSEVAQYARDESGVQQTLHEHCTRLWSGMRFFDAVRALDRGGEKEGLQRWVEVVKRTVRTLE